MSQIVSLEILDTLSLDEVYRQLYLNYGPAFIPSTEKEDRLKLIAVAFDHNQLSAEDIAYVGRRDEFSNYYLMSDANLMALAAGRSGYSSTLNRINTIKRLMDQQILVENTLPMLPVELRRNIEDYLDPPEMARMYYAYPDLYVQEQRQQAARDACFDYSSIDLIKNKNWFCLQRVMQERPEENLAAMTDTLNRLDEEGFRKMIEFGYKPTRDHALMLRNAAVQFGQIVETYRSNLSRGMRPTPQAKESFRQTSRIMASVMRLTGIMMAASR